MGGSFNYLSPNYFIERKTTQMGDKNIVRSMVSIIDKLVTNRIGKAPFDKTYSGTISKVLFNESTLATDKLYNKYTVKFNGTERNFYINDGYGHSVNEQIYVVVPCGKLSKKYIQCPNAIKRPSKIDYNEAYSSDSELLTIYYDIFNTANTENKFKVSKKYEIKLTNKGTSQESSVSVILPDEKIIELVGF